jgi:phosphoesterase RecJ-like protein
MVEAVQESILPEALPAEFDGARVVAVDTASPSQMGALYERLGERVVCMIDHHGRSTPFADHYTVPTAAAAGELIWRIYGELSRRGEPVTATKRFCALLYAAISSDTGSFRHSNTTPDTLRLVAELMERGIDTAAVTHRLYECKPLAQLKVDHQIYRLLRLHADGQIGILPFPYALKEELGIRDEHLETLVDAVRVLEGVRVACSIRQPSAEPVFRVSMRSSCGVDVAQICASFGGGGHVKAAGCTLQVASIEEAEATVAHALSDALAALPADEDGGLGDFA